MSAKQAKPAPKKRLSVECLLSEIETQCGNISAIARSFGVRRQSVSEYIERRPELKQALADAREGMLDEAENALLDAIRSKEGWAVCFALKTIGRNRGYVEKQEIEMSGPVIPEINVSIEQPRTQES